MSERLSGHAGTGVHFPRHYQPPIGTKRDYRKRLTTQAVRVEGPFSVETREGVLVCQNGWLAWDANGDPYPIAADVFEQTYEAVE